ncbi:twin-arginine translocase TatA/TatE family subunit [Halobaculum sp. MBLA0143]|uniref:twin-arginine translocase TatA/TatE family subunit n=1 Tax=Halobaculum sp. MBLA0143 TaxID=3079933 RepID=UPI003523E1FE
MLPTAPLFGAIPGGPEMIVILLVLVLLFGANKIPKLARSTGQAMGEFKKGREEIEDELEEMQGDDEDADTDFVETEMGSNSNNNNS